MEGVECLVEGRPLAIVIDASSLGLDVLVRSHGWLELNQGKETTLAEQFGEEMYQDFANWLGRFETGLLSKGWSPRHSTVMYRKMVLLEANGSWYKVRLMVHLPKTSLVSIDGSPRPVLLSMERVKPIRGPRSPLFEHANLESITEGSEEDFTRWPPCRLRRPFSCAATGPLLNCDLRRWRGPHFGPRTRSTPAAARAPRTPR